MKILGLILARGGSKRVPGKNIRPLGGKPLIMWTIECAKSVSDICDILVSTDSDEIAAVCRSAGVLVPWLRPPELSADDANSIDSALHALDWYTAQVGPIDGVMLLQPTSPFRSSSTVMRAIELFVDSEHRPVIGVSPTQVRVGLYFIIENGVLRSCIPSLSGDSGQLSSLPAFILNGAMYLVEPNYMRYWRRFHGEDACPLIMANGLESLDIDTEEDFSLAEYYVSQRMV